MSIRRKQAWRAKTVLGRVYDQDADALVTLDGSPAVRYVSEDGEAFHKRVVTADDDNPNVTPPAVDDIVGMGELYGTLVFTLDVATGAQADVLVWALTELDPGTTSWVLVKVITAISDEREYQVNTGYRAVFFQIDNTSGVSGGAPATLRAAPV